MFSQVADIEWQNTIGGDLDDFIADVVETIDGGYIVGGYSNSNLSGDKTEVKHQNDYWVIKLDNVGNIQWQNTIGGNKDDYLKCIKQTPDGGYILAGNSNSDISYDKSEACIGLSDYWIVKLNGAGNIEWQNTIGGSASDDLFALCLTSDGGYMIGGSSRSDISGDKTENRYGVDDYWIVKLNSSGNIQWQNTIGGDQSDVLKSLKQTSDGGFILGGNSASSISGDKTESHIGLGTATSDYWIVKINISGVIEWQNTIGGTSIESLYDIEQTTDGGYIIAGSSYSDISDDKSENCFLSDLGYHFEDYWVVKVDNLGVIEWENTIGGKGGDRLVSVEETSDGNFILGGGGNSLISGDVTEAMLGLWIVKINNEGNIIWQNAIGTSSGAGGGEIHQTSDDGYIIAGGAAGPISGDKTEPGLGAQDYWIIKLFPDCVLTPEMCNSIDDNCNGLIDDDVTETISISAAGITTFCDGGSVLLNATTSGPNYQWKKNGANITGATSSTYLANTKGTFTCETISACDIQESTGIFVNVQMNPPAAITAGGPTTFCMGSSVVLSANTGGGLSYKWFKNGISIPGANSSNYTVTTAGNYKCRVTKVVTGCAKNSNIIIVTVPCKEGEEVTVENELIIYPNPNNGSFNVTCTTTQNNSNILVIYNALGQQIYAQLIFTESGRINENIVLNNLAVGVYFIHLNGKVQKLIIE